MKNIRNYKMNIFESSIIFLTFSFILFLIFTIHHSDDLEAERLALDKIRELSSSVQRIARLELENSSDDVLIVLTEDLVDDLLVDYEYFVFNKKISLLLDAVIDSWYNFKDSISIYRTYGRVDRVLFFTNSENNYFITTSVIKQLTVYITENDDFVNELRTILFSHIFVITLLLFKILFDKHYELIRYNALSKEMLIDEKTGLFNRSKCQVILNSPLTPVVTNERAIILFNLDNFSIFKKNLNGKLISCFSTKLKNATKIFPYEAFIGRYSENEFLVYFSSIEKNEVELYIKEVFYLIEKFNMQKNKRFKLSCFSGYTITDETTSSLTLQQLFDVASEDLNNKKIALRRN